MSKYRCPECGDNTELRAVVTTVAWIKPCGAFHVDTDVDPEIDDDATIVCDACGWDGPANFAENIGPDPDEQLERKEAREHTERWVGRPDDHSDDGDALASAGFGTNEDYGG